MSGIYLHQSSTLNKKEVQALYRLNITYCTSCVLRKDLEVLSLEEITSPTCAKNNSTSLSVMSGGLYPKENVRNFEKREVGNKFYI